MSKEELPSIEDLHDENLPSIEDFIEGDDNLPSVENVVENNNLPLVEEVNEDNDLPSVEDYIEEESVSIEDVEGNTFAEVEDIIPPWPELLKIINDVREAIPDIPEIKYYDAELEKLCEIVDEVRSEIPEVKYYDAEVEAICEQIDLVRDSISELPEVKYYDEQIDSIENRINLIKEDIINLPEPKYYDNDLQSIREDIEIVKKNFPWIEANFRGVEESFENVNDSIGTVEEKISLELDSLLETIDIKVFENKVLINEVKDNFAEDKQQILADIKESSQKIFDLHDEFKDDDRKLKKQIQGEYNKLKQSVQEQLEKYNQESVKTDELLLKYFTDLKEEISKTPEVKYYDDDIDVLQESLTKSNKRFLPIESDIKSLYKIVEDIKKTQVKLNEQILEEPPSASQDVGGEKDPLTPTDQKFATLDDLSKHYRLFVNRIQKQLATVGGGGAGFIKDLDDVSFDQTTGTNKLLIYDGAKWVGIASTALSSGSGSVGAAGTWAVTSAGIHTTKNVGIATTARSDFALYIEGDQFIDGNITVGGTITYEDVTNVDSVGIVTARIGVDVLAGGINVTGVSTFNSALNVSGTINDHTIPSGSGTFALTSDVPTNNNQLTNGAGYITTSFTNTNQLTNGAGFVTFTNNNQLTNGAGYITTSFTNTNQLTNGAGFVTFTNNNQLTNGAGYITTSFTNTNQLTNGAGFVTFTNNNQLINGAGYITTSFTNTNQLTNGAGFVTFTNNNQLTNGAGYITTSFTNTNQLTNGAGFITASDDITGTAAGLSGTPNITVGIVTASSFVGNLTGSATSLSGVSSSFLLDYNNFTNTPTIPTNNNQLTNGAGFVTFTNNNQLTNGAGYITTSFTNTNQLTNGAGFITASDDITGTSAGLSGSPDITVGSINATSAEFSGNVTIGGTLTYEDVTNIDSVGVVTARNGINVLAGGVNAVGISTFSTGIGTVHIGTGNTTLLVKGDARVTGILTIGEASVTIDGDNNSINVGIVTISNSEVVIGENVTIRSGATGINSAPNILYVAKDGNDTNNGTSIDNAFLTIKAAVGAAQSGTTVKVLSGNYVENNPIELPAFSAVVGDDLRTVKVLPSNATQDLFHVNKACKLANMTFSGHLHPAAAVAFPTGIATNVGGGKWKGPYIQNCTSDTTTGTGIRVDGNLAVKTKSMNVDAFTQYNQGGVGVAVTNEGYAQLVSVFTICCDKAITVHKGGQADVANSNCSFGTFGLVADGKGDLQYIGTCTAAADAAQDTITMNVGSATTRPYDGQIAFFGQLFESVQTITVGSGGTGYTSTPTVTVDAPTGPSGENATAFATLEGESVASITIISSGSQYESTPSVTISGPDVGINTATATANMSPIYYTINSSTPIVSGITTVTFEENLINAVGVGTSVHFFQQSKIIASSHTFEYIGAGNTITEATPKRGGVTIQANEVTKSDGGNVVYTSTDQSGNFKIGDDLTINQTTGTISGRAFSKSLFSEMTPFILALS